MHVLNRAYAGRTVEIVQVVQGAMLFPRHGHGNVDAGGGKQVGIAGKDGRNDG